MHRKRARRCKVIGHKEREQFTYPHVSAVHDFMTVHLMHLLMFQPYI